MAEPMKLLVLGGARSGKTRRALALAETAASRIYIATAQAWDEEMRVRIDRHRAERGAGWSTLEVPLELAPAIATAAAEAGGAVIVVDCLTLWLSNLMHAGRDADVEGARLADAVVAARAAVIVVSNEVGLGIVPDNALARAFRDAQGRLNQRLAAALPTVEFIAAGLAMRLKG